MRNDLPAGLSLPRSLHDIDAAYLTALLRSRGLISETNAVVATEDSDVGMTAGYFSAIKRTRCTYLEATDAPDSFIVKAWPDFEMASQETIADMFVRDIKGYLVDEDRFYPRPRAYLADFEAEEDLWALVMEDACSFAEQKLHENEMSVDDVMHMIPRMVDVALAWEGCHESEKALKLEELGVDHWASDANLATFRHIMPGGAKLFDHVTTMSTSSLLGSLTWDKVLGPGIAELLTRKLDAYYGAVKPQNGGTCTLAHGDLRGDNVFFCAPSKDHPDGWLTIDFQLMFQGPVPSDLAYLMNSGSVLPEVYSAQNRELILRAFYDRFMAGTQIYRNYTWEQFLHEFSIMATVEFVYYVGFGAAIWQAGLNNEQPGRIELGDKGATIDDLAPDERRKRMWWTKTLANMLTTFKDFNHYEQLSRLPDNTSSMASWVEVPERLRD